MAPCGQESFQAVMEPRPHSNHTTTNHRSPNGNHNNHILEWFEEEAEKASLVQTKTLRRILELNWGVEYLKKWFGDKDIGDVEAGALESLYTSLVPVASHADFETYIQRIADGEETTPLITRQPITTLSLSSGTTEGRQKYVPFTHHSSHTTLQIFRLSAAHRSRVYPTREGGRILEFIYSSKQSKTRGGLSVGTATTHYYASEEFKIKQEKTKSFTCSPQEVISGGDHKQSTYCHLLLGLFFSDQVEFITSTFAYSLVQAFSSLEEQWESICSDIETGTLSTRAVTMPRMRKSVSGTITPDPSLASRIRTACQELEGLEWEGLVPKLWPNAKYLYSIMTGSMQPYSKKLRHYSGGLPLVSGDYGSTESWIGVNVDPWLPPEEVTFAVVPSYSYFEFIPLYRQKQQGQCCCLSAIDDHFLEEEPVPLSKVKVGQEYEIVLTTFTGLYRYRLGDVVEVAGFHKTTPKLNFICRRKLILAINIDKNTEKDLQLVVERASRLLTGRAELIDFTSHADVASQPGHYVVYWEIRGEADDGVLGECCREMDASFVDHGYVVSRRSSSIGPLELRVVERGTFGKIMDYFIGNGAAVSQFKIPRCTTNQVILRILYLSTVKRILSTAYG